MSEPTEAIHGYTITAYSCECPEHPNHHLARRENRWQLTLGGIAWSYTPDETVEDIKANHRNVKPIIPSGIRDLLDQIDHWKMRALEAEARRVPLNTP